MENSMVEVEYAAQIMLLPTNKITEEQRKNAENVILEFRKMQNPYGICRKILESSRNEYLLFEASNLIGYCVVKEWIDICQGQAIELKKYLLKYLVDSPNVYHSVRENIVMTLAFIMEKEETPLEDKDCYFFEITQLLNSGTPHMIILGCSLAQATCQEKLQNDPSQIYPYTCNDFHKKFEVEQLLELYKIVLKNLTETARHCMADHKMVPVLLRLILLAEEILTWPFMRSSMATYPRPKLHRSTIRNGTFAQTMFEPYLEWKSCVLSEDTIRIFFELYETFKKEWELGHRLLNCLIQLSTLSGKCMSNVDDNVKYVKLLCTYLHNFLSRNDIQENEAFGFASMIMKISLSNYTLQSTGLLVPAMEVVLEDIYNLTMKFIVASANERNIDPEDQLYTEALDKLLTALEAIGKNKGNDEEHQNILLSFYKKIFVTFLQHHLSAPEGLRLMSEDEREISEESQPDYKFYSIQISMIAQFGAKKIENCLNDLTNVLETRAAQLKKILYKRRENTLDQSCFTVFEDIYWLLMIAGQLLACPSNLDELRAFNVLFEESHKDRMDKVHKVCEILFVFNGTENIISTLNWKHNFVETGDIHPFVRLLAVIIQIWKMDIESVFIESRFLLSPEVSNTIIWLMRKFYGVSYHPNGRWNVFGELFPESTHAELLTMAIRATYIVVNNRSSELELVENYCKFLFELPKDYYFCKTKLVDIPLFEELVKCSFTGDLARVSPTGQKGLVKALVHCGMGFRKGVEMSNYFNCLISTYLDHFRLTIDNRNQAQNSLQIDRKIICHLDNLIGIYDGVAGEFADLVFSWTEKGLDMALLCLTHFHNCRNIVEAVLECLLAASRIIMRISKENLIIYYKHIMSMIELYASYNIGKRVYNAEGEEDRFTDLQLIMRILSNIMITDYTHSFNLTDSCGVTQHSLGIYGMRLILPLLNTEILKDPKICFNFYRFVKEISLRSSKHLLLLKELLSDLLMWVELGMYFFDSEVTTLSFDFVGNVCNFLAEHEQHELKEIMKPFLRIILRLLIHHKLNSDAVEGSCYVVCMLIALYKEEFDNFMTDAIEYQSSPGLQKKLLEVSGVLREKCQQKNWNYIVGDAIEPYEKFLSMVALCRCKYEPPSENRFSMRSLAIALGPSIS